MAARYQRASFARFGRIGRCIGRDRRRSERFLAEISRLDRNPNAASKAGQLTVWLWSPDGPAMDLRTYDTVPHGLQTNYEDWKPGWGTAHGIAHSADLTLWAFSAIPSDAELVTMAKMASAPPILVCTPRVLSCAIRVRSLESAGPIRADEEMGREPVGPIVRVLPRPGR